ncbi:MAG: outer-membrane lipoprotein carrier protein LolA [Candidatus Kapabacteria bacterium]|jgi:outer membrane lipoprotein-sorting protein|nr:outer-membrane lipoprotein carrier protein LolA [Candidatus Kapabacteria bacterium]
MKKTQHLLIIIALFLSVIGTAFGEKSKEDVYNYLKNKYADAKALTVDFEIKDVNAKGSLSVKRGNKYKIEFNDRIIVCDGKNLWNYDKAQKKVILSSYEKDDESVNLEDFFFSFLRDYKPTAISVRKLENGRGQYLLTLKPSSDSKKLNQVNELILSIDIKTMKIASVSVDDADIFMTWEISNLKTRKNLSDKIFDFRTPKGTELIDLR